MKKAVKQIKMADLHFVEFALIPSPVRKEKQFRLPDDFSEPILSRPRSVFPRFFEFSHRGQTAVRRSVLEMFYTFTRAGRSKKFQHFRSQR